ncbi:MAG: radical SAM protein [Patescibacteria group bacterium]|nr:radical SAM protein [Patescibacteria group bacterium]
MFPSYLNLSKKELRKRVERAIAFLNPCQICPRKCKINRLKNEKGFCRLGRKAKVSSFHPHFGEEKFLVGVYGSGTIFFTSCNLACIFCQNYEISQLDYGQEVSAKNLAEIMIYLQKIGCHNINLVTPTPQVPQILEALEIAIEKKLKIPLVYNSNGYDSVETLKVLEGIIDIYMPDAKYFDNQRAIKYSSAPNYFAIMKEAIKEMHRQVGDLITENGVAKKGLIVRHLILPNDLAGTEKIMKFLAEEISKETFVNIMDQYYPCYKAFQCPELSRRIILKEYQAAINLAKKYGLYRFAD